MSVRPWRHSHWLAGRQAPSRLRQSRRQRISAIACVAGWWACLVGISLTWCFRSCDERVGVSYASLRVDREPADVPPAADAAVPDGPDQSTQCLLIAGLYGSRALLQNLLFRKQHQLRCTPQHQRNFKRRTRSQRVPQQAGQTSLNGRAVCPHITGCILSDALHRGADEMEHLCCSGLPPPRGCRSAGTCRHDNFLMQICVRRGWVASW